MYKLKKIISPYFITAYALVLAFFLACIWLPNQLFFYYDQARDAFSAYNIWHNFHLPILGPMTDIPGLFHGVIWYYFLAIPYFLGNNNPYFTGYFLLALLFLSLPFCGYLTQKLFKNRNVTIISLIIYSFSPLFQISTRWVSNPTLSLLATPFLLIFLWNYINKQSRKSALGVAVCLGIIIHSNFAFAFFLVLLPLYFLVFRLKLKMWDLLTFIAGLLITLSTFILAEIKFHGRSISALIDFFKASHSSSSSLANFPQAVLNKFLEFLSVSLLPLPTIVVLVITATVLIIFVTKLYLKSVSVDKKPVIFLLIWLSNIIFFELFNVGISRSIFVFFPSLLALVILGSYFLYKLVGQKVILFVVLTVVVIFQINQNLIWIKNTINPLTVQVGMTYANEQKVVNYTYKASNGKHFTINTITNPLYINTTWAFLYEFYGQSKYHYLPFWDGRDQQGYLGNLPTTKNLTKIRYLIIEPTTGIPDFFVKEAVNAENVKSKIVDEKKIGNFVVQKRELK